jgi:hypothetical protein
LRVQQSEVQAQILLVRLFITRLRVEGNSTPKPSAKISGISLRLCSWLDAEIASGLSLQTLETQLWTRI